jgi:lipoate---protein ligase
VTGNDRPLTVNEDLLLCHEQEGAPAWRVYEPQGVSAVLGAGGSPEKDLLLGNLAADGIPFLFRRGGGGTVVLSPGQVVLAVVTEVSSPFRNKEYAAAINGWFVEALAGLGVAGVQERGISDLAIGERKILGTSIYRRRLTLFYQASLLVSNDLSLFDRFLAMPSRVPDYRRGRGHREFCTTLAAEGFTFGTAAVAAALDAVVARRVPALS